MAQKKKVPGKNEKALRKLSAVDTEINHIKNILKEVKEKLKPLIDKYETDQHLKANTELISDETKQRCMIETLPKRIEFKYNYLKFYIDFTVVTQDNDASVDVKGCMIYGVNRSTCFATCIFPKGATAKCKYCERVSRCDGLEDKPLIQFFIDRHEMIQSAGEFEDSWWIKKKDDLPELHFRTMELIWPKALAWTNENLLA
jgi:hypothetical protein